MNTKKEASKAAAAAESFRKTKNFSFNFCQQVQL